MTHPIDLIYATPTKLKVGYPLYYYFHRYKDCLELREYLNNDSYTLYDPFELYTFTLGANHCFEFSRRFHEEIHSTDNKKRQEYYQGHTLTTTATFKDDTMKEYMSRSVTTPIKRFKTQRTLARSHSSRNRGILKPRSDSSTSSDSFIMLPDLQPVPDTDWYIYDKYDYIGNMDALYINSVYTAKINKIASNPRNSRHYGTSNPCAPHGKTGHTFDEFNILQNYDLFKIHYIIFLLHKKRLNQL